MTKSSHDSGADLIVKTPAGEVVLQLKLWGQRVGKRAILEALAGKAYYHAEHAAVVSPSGFTAEAILLAGEHGVKIFDFYEIYQKLIIHPAIFVATLLSEYQKRCLGFIELYNEYPSDSDQPGVIFSEEELWPIRPSEVFAQAWKVWPGGEMPARPSTKLLTHTNAKVEFTTDEIKKLGS